MDSTNSSSIVLTGMGIISSIGTNLTDFEKALYEGKSGIDFLSSQVSGESTVTIGAELKDFSFKSLLEKYSGPEAQKAKKCAFRSPLHIQTAVLAALEGWSQAGLDRQPIDPERIGIIVGGNNLSTKYQYKNHDKVIKNPEYLSPKYALHFMDTDCVGTLSDILTIRGEGCTIGGASASGNVALIKAWQLLKADLLDACLVIGSLADLSSLELQAFTNLGAYGSKIFEDRPLSACRPFDEAHEGFIYGQGCGCVILEKSLSARKRGVPALAEMASGVIGLDGNRLSNPSEEGESRVMKKALELASCAPGDVGYINAHGSSSSLGDQVEIQSIKKVFQNTLNQVYINSTKSLTGHCLWAAGVVECIATVIQMNSGFIHPNLNLDSPICGECRFAGPTSIKEEFSTALSNSFGFGGINSSIVIRKT